MDDEYNDETKNEEEEEEEQGCAIAIVGTGACPHCKRAKSALDKLGFPCKGKGRTTNQNVFNVIR